MDGLRISIRKEKNAPLHIASQRQTGDLGKEMGRSVDVVKEQSQGKEVRNAENDAPEQHGGHEDRRGWQGGTADSERGTAARGSTWSGQRTRTRQSAGGVNIGQTRDECFFGASDLYGFSSFFSCLCSFSYSSQDRPGGGRGSCHGLPADCERSGKTLNGKGLCIISS